MVVTSVEVRSIARYSLSRLRYTVVAALPPIVCTQYSDALCTATATSEAGQHIRIPYTEHTVRRAWTAAALVVTRGVPARPQSSTSAIHTLQRASRLRASAPPRLRASAPPRLRAFAPSRLRALAPSRLRAGVLVSVTSKWNQPVCVSVIKQPLGTQQIYLFTKSGLGFVRKYCIHPSNNAAQKNPDR